MAACAHAGTAPDDFHFSFSGEYTVEKKGNKAFISYKRAWRDARRPPPEGYLSENPAVSISVEQAQRTWEAIAAIDFGAYREPAASDFKQTPPDMGHTESLKLVVDGQAVADWSRGYALLIPDLRRPLTLINDVIREIYEKAAQ